MKLQEYLIDFLTVTQAQSIRSDCNELTFFNAGADACIINNSIRLGTGQSLTINGNFGEIDRTNYYVTFVGGIQGNLIVVRKTYV